MTHIKRQPELMILKHVLKRIEFIADLNLTLNLDSFVSFHLFSPDCESHCKASKGKMKITMKKYCKKDYGE